MGKSLFFKLFFVCVIVTLWGKATLEACPKTSLSRSGGLPSSWQFLPEVENFKTPDQFESFLNNVWFKPELESHQRVLTSVTYVHGKLLFDSLLNVVRACDQQVAIWGNAREHATYYRLKQGPWRWFAKKAAGHEIDGYITLLKGRRGMYAGQLGDLNTALHKVREASYVGLLEQDLEPLRHLIRVVHSIVSDTNDCFMSDETDNVVLKSYVIQNIRKSVNYERAALRSMNKLGLPGHLRRNFMLYALSAVGVAAAGTYFYCNWNKAPIWRDKLVKLSKSVYDNFRGKIKGLRDAIWSLEEKKDGLNDIYEKVCQDRDKTESELVEKAHVFLGHMHPDKTEEERGKMIDHALATGGVVDLIVEYSEFPDGNPETWTSKYRVDKKVQSFWNELKILIIEWKSIKKRMFEIAEALLERAIKIDQNNIKNNALTLAAAAMVVPVAGVYYSYSWLTSKKRWFRKIKDALVRVRVIMDYSGSDQMSESERSGMLIYALNDLERKAKSLPKHEWRRFRADIAFLRSCACNDQKVQRIDSMIGPYQFLGG